MRLRSIQFFQISKILFTFSAVCLQKIKKIVQFSNAFWLYQLGVRSASFLSYSTLLLTLLILDTLYYSFLSITEIFVFVFFLLKYIGKEIILRRYLNDQSPELVKKPGFLNVAMNHLKETTKTSRHSKRRPTIPPPPAASLDG